MRVGVAVCVEVAVGVHEPHMVGVGARVLVAVGVGVGRLVLVGIGVRVGRSVLVGIGVRVGRSVLVGIGVRVGRGLRAWAGPMPTSMTQLIIASPSTPLSTLDMIVFFTHRAIARLTRCTGVRWLVKIAPQPRVDFKRRPVRQMRACDGSIRDV